MDLVSPTLDPAGWFLEGNTLFDRGETAAAIGAFRRCLALAPDHAGTLYNLGNALLRAGQPVEAVDHFLACLRLTPAFPGASVNLGEALRQVGLLDQAQWAAEQGLRRAPGSPEAKSCLAAILHDRCDFAAAAALYHQALTAMPGHPGVLSSLANTLHAMDRFEEALTLHERAVAAAPEDADIHFNHAATLLAARRFARGWDAYEWRWLRAQARPRGFGPAWNGEDIAGRTILLHAEQGLGDTLQFVRYAPMVAERGARVVLEVQPSLAGLMRGVPGVARVVARGETLPPFDAHCPLLSLPRVFRTRIDSIPADTPYLRADPAATVAWSARLPAGDHRRVGLVWAGAGHDDDAGGQLMDRRRSLPLADFAPLGRVNGVTLVNLRQHDPSAPFEVPDGMQLFDPMAGVTDFADTAAVVAHLDLVISVDTSVAHLAGAMGKPVWLLSRFNGCWRWMRDRNDSPWYPGMRIYRQSVPLDWSGVLADVRRDLEAFAASPA